MIESFKKIDDNGLQKDKGKIKGDINGEVRL